MIRKIALGSLAKARRLQRPNAHHLLNSNLLKNPWESSVPTAIPRKPSGHRVLSGQSDTAVIKDKGPVKLAKEPRTEEAQKEPREGGQM